MRKQIVWGMLLAGALAGCDDAKSSDTSAGDGGDDVSEDGSTQLGPDATSGRDAQTGDPASSLDAAESARDAQADDGSSSPQDASAGGDAAEASAADATAASDAANGSDAAADAGPTMLSSATASLDFNKVEVGVESSAQTWTITNTGSSTSGALTLTNPAPSQLLVTNQCSAPLAAGASCSLSVKVKPSSGGAFSGRLTLRSVQSGSLSLDVSATGVYRLTIVRSGTGTVSSTVGSLSCGATCSGLFDPGTQLTLQARTSNGAESFFSGWSIATCGSLRDCPVTLAASTTVNATFSSMTHNLVFVTAGTYPTNRGSAAAYDADCNAAATAAGINNAAGNAYVAATTDTATSVAGRLGSARGWVRMDGKPFKDVFSGPGGQDPVLNTVRYTEHGEAVGSFRDVMAGLPNSGASYNCRNFTSTSNADTVSSGLTEGGPGRWILGSTGGTYLMCSDGPYRIICLGKTKTTAVPATPVAGRQIWISTGTYQPPSTTPDQVCQSGKPAAVTTAVALVDRAGQAHGQLLSPSANYYRPDGTFVGTGQLLADDQIDSGIWQDAAGNYLSSVDANIVTGGGVGTFAGTCSNWTSSAGMASGGDFTRTEGEQWWRAFNLPCSTMDLRFYCVQTAP